MVANLVDNAIKHNSVDGWLAVRTNQLDGTAVIEIDNTGPEVSAEQIPTLFEPFVRAAERLDPQAGVGLGLSIAGAIATAHAATISAHPREGGGLEIAVSVPAPQH
jgi:signal transduction histidine kinase